MLFSTAFVNARVSKVWVADNGDGTYKNPIIYAEYSDPDAIRVGTPAKAGTPNALFIIDVCRLKSRGQQVYYKQGDEIGRRGHYENDEVTPGFVEYPAD